MMQVAPKLLVETKLENLVLLERSGMPQEPLTGTHLPEPMHAAWLTSDGTAVQLPCGAKDKAKFCSGEIAPIGTETARQARFSANSADTIRDHLRSSRLRR